MPVLFLIFFISAGVLFAKEYYEDKEIREQGIENTIKNLSHMAARALWNLEIDHANQIVKAIAQNNNISAARIKDVDNKIFAEYESIPKHHNNIRLVIYELFIEKNSNWADFTEYKDVIENNKKHIKYKSPITKPFSSTEKGIKQNEASSLPWEWIERRINNIFKKIFLPKTLIHFNKI